MVQYVRSLIQLHADFMHLEFPASNKESSDILHLEFPARIIELTDIMHLVFPASNKELSDMPHQILMNNWATPYSGGNLL